MSEDLKTYTFSQLQRMLACPRKYKWSYEMLMGPAYDGVPLPVGTAIHLGVDLLVKGASREDALCAAITRYWTDIPKGLYAEMEDKERDRIRTGEIQIETAIKKYPWLNVEGTQLIASEVTVVMPMGHGRAYKGKIDQVIVHNGGAWIHDTKTTGSNVRDAVRAMRLRKQFSGYFLLGTHWINNQGAEANAPKVELRGVMSDIIVKPRTYFRKDGGVTVSGDGFHREPLHISPAAVEDFKGWFHYVANQIELNQWMDNPKTNNCIDVELNEDDNNTGVLRQVPHRRSAWPMNTDTCMAFNRLCPFYQACLNPERAAQLFQDTRQFKKREELHPEYREEGAA